MIVEEVRMGLRYGKTKEAKEIERATEVRMKMRWKKIEELVGKLLNLREEFSSIVISDTSWKVHEEFDEKFAELYAELEEVYYDNSV